MAGWFHEKGPLFLFFSTILLIEEFFCIFSKFFSGTCPLVQTVRRAKKANESRNKRGTEELTGAPNDNFRKNICSEDDLKARIFGTFVVKFLACLLLLGFSNI